MSNVHDALERIIIGGAQSNVEHPFYVLLGKISALENNMDEHDKYIKMLQEYVLFIDARLKEIINEIREENNERS